MKTNNVMLDTLERKRDLKRDKKKRQKDKKKETNDGGTEVSSLAVRTMSLEHSKEHWK